MTTKRHRAPDVPVKTTKSMDAVRRATAHKLLPEAPETFTYRLPKAGEGGDPFWGLSRAWYYEAEARGWLTLIRIIKPGCDRGIVLVPFKQVADFVRSQQEKQMEAQMNGT